MISIPPPSWLPPIIPFSGTNEEYIECLYEHFKSDFIHNFHTFNGKPLYLKRNPFVNGKEEDFWHILFGKGNFDLANIDTLRCERLPWVLPIICRANDGLDGVVKWKNTTNGDLRICLMTDYPHAHIVVIAERRNKNLLFTSHPVGKKQYDKNMEIYREYKKTEAAS